jgi:hypothetical protein
MFYPTAQAYSDIRFRQPAIVFTIDPAAALIPQQVAVFPLASDQKLGEIDGPVTIAAKWISTIQRRIEQSVPDPLIAASLDDGEWLDSDIATYAISFFNATSDVLPISEPYLYTASNGDLIAEFAGHHGKLTNVIGKTAVNSFAIVDGQMVKTTLKFPFDNIAKARQELMQLASQL